MTQFLPGKFTLYNRILKSTACVALVHKATDKICIIIFFKPFGAKKINELAVTSNKLTNNFPALITSGLEPDVACRLPVGSGWPK
jgi:hypothetical protein